MYPHLGVFSIITCMSRWGIAEVNIIFYNSPKSKIQERIAFWLMKYPIKLFSKENEDCVVAVTAGSNGQTSKILEIKFRSFYSLQNRKFKYSE